MPHSYEQYKEGYQQLFDTCIISNSKKSEIDTIVEKIMGKRSRYEAVSILTGVPWEFIAIVHGMEGALNFKTHLHNGDSLTARTLHVPKGRPKKGSPPFTWEDSAADALNYVGLTEWTDWSAPGLLYCFEKYNGFGYRSRGINSPYLWSYSNHYKKGKFTMDGHFDPTAVSKQCGAVVLLRKIYEKESTPPIIDMLAQIKVLGEQVVYDPGHFHTKAKQLQQLLNATDKKLAEDGRAGRNTSNAYFSVTGKYLNGDPKTS